MNDEQVAQSACHCIITCCVVLQLNQKKVALFIQGNIASLIQLDLSKPWTKSNWKFHVVFLHFASCIYFRLQTYLQWQHEYLVRTGHSSLCSCTSLYPYCVCIYYLLLQNYSFLYIEIHHLHQFHLYGSNMCLHSKISKVFFSCQITIIQALTKLPHSQSHFSSSNFV